MKPLIITNFKTSKEATGENALKLARAHEQAAKSKGADVIIAVQNADIYRIVSAGVSIPVFAQHADPVEYGSHTGSQLPEALKAAGASGVVINHAERKLPNDEVIKIVARCKQSGLKALVCVETLEKVPVLLKSNPDYLAFEVPELIGTLKSLSRLQPHSVRKFAEIVDKYNKTVHTKVVPLCGAGVADGADVAKALELGTRGVLVATAIVGAHDPKKMIEEMASVSV